MKAYTNLEQSKKLVEILPLESADMYYHNRIDIPDNFPLPIEWKHNNPLLSQEIPCWSLAALLTIIPYAIHKSDNEFYRLEIDKGHNYYDIWYSNNSLTVNDLDVTSNNFVDACVAMIEKLHELKML